MIKAEIVADSLSPQGDRLTSLLITFPRIILAEVNTHRMLSKNTSSSRAIPFNKMVEAIQEEPFIPIAWQKDHKGMQGNEYLTPNTKDLDYESLERDWLQARDFAVQVASELNDNGEGFGVTKQLCNRLLEPFMWTTMLITGSKEGWDNFFHLRCPNYEIAGVKKLPDDTLVQTPTEYVKSKKEAIAKFPQLSIFSDLNWLHINKGQAEIHMMDLAEKIYDAINESTPKQLQADEWHIPFEDKLFNRYYDFEMAVDVPLPVEDKIKVSVAMAARTSYTVVGNEKEIDYSKMIDLHDRLIAQDPPHSSPLEHCARAMSDEEYFKSYRGNTLPFGYANKEDALIEGYLDKKDKNVGWCGPYKGFISYRYFIDNNLKI